MCQWCFNEQGHPTHTTCAQHTPLCNYRHRTVPYWLLAFIASESLWYAPTLSSARNNCNGDSSDNTTHCHYCRVQLAKSRVQVRRCNRWHGCVNWELSVPLSNGSYTKKEEKNIKKKTPNKLAGYVTSIPQHWMWIWFKTFQTGRL